MGNKEEIYYMDDDYNIVEKKDATKCVVRVLDENGDLIKEVWADM